MTSAQFDIGTFDTCYFDIYVSPEPPVMATHGIVAINAEHSNTQRASEQIAGTHKKEQDMSGTVRFNW